MEQEVPEMELRADDDVAVVELPRDQASAAPPIEETVAAALGDAVELGRQTAHVREFHHVMLPSVAVVAAPLKLC